MSAADEPRNFKSRGTRNGNWVLTICVCRTSRHFSRQRQRSIIIECVVVVLNSYIMTHTFFFFIFCMAFIKIKILGELE